MTKLLYWLVYNFDLGPMGPRMMDLAVKSWLRRDARANEPSLLQSTMQSVRGHELNYGK
jgi:hypothetical protein